MMFLLFFFLIVLLQLSHRQGYGFRQQQHNRHRLLIPQHHHHQAKPTIITRSSSSLAAATTNRIPSVEPNKNNDSVTFSSSIQLNGNSRPSAFQTSHIDVNGLVINSKKKKPGILLNLNARQVSSEMETIANRVLGNDDDDGVTTTPTTTTVFCTTDAAQAQDAARQMAQNLEDYSVMIPVGGDGTLCSFLQTLCEAIQEVDPDVSCFEQAMAKLPPIGYIPLGTGNGMGSVVGCKSQNNDNGARRRRLVNLFRRKRARLDTFEATLRRLASYPGANTDDDDNDKNDAPFDDLIEVPMIQVTTRRTQATNQLDGDDDNNNNENPSPITSTTSTSSVDMSDFCFFAGIGFDSLMLNDFSIIKSWANQRRTVLPGFVKRWLSSVAGYCVALVVRTLPQCVVKGAHRIRVRVTAPPTTPTTSSSSSSDVLWIDHRRGDMMRPCKNHDNNNNANGDASSSSQQQELLVYQGTTGILAAGTCPFYGGGLRLFPFAGLAKQPDRMHLRLGRIHPLTGFFNIPRIFAGTYRDASPRDFGCLDFVGTEFRVQVLQSEDDRTSSSSLQQQKAKYAGFPLQHSGETIGNVNEFQLKVLSEPVRFVSFLPPRVIIDE